MNPSSDRMQEISRYDVTRATVGTCADCHTQDREIKEVRSSAMCGRNRGNRLRPDRSNVMAKKAKKAKKAKGKSAPSAKKSARKTRRKAKAK